LNHGDLIADSAISADQQGRLYYRGGFRCQAIIFQKKKEAFQLANVARSPVSGCASYRASLICQPVVFRSSPNNPFSNRTSRSATNIHSADPWMTVWVSPWKWCE
ncbi:hypothetical protein, partial [Endozoicomonas acroporae]|uniref:hypothetical protein n=1 Tax=Endozoicomonas acroporae TaxID=1701104 RepID=UPI003D79E1BB